MAQPSLFDTEDDEPAPVAPPKRFVASAPMWEPPDPDDEDDFFRPRASALELSRFLEEPDPSRPPFEPRDYQRESDERLAALRAGGARSAFLKLPTGTGKTACIAMAIRRAIRQFPDKAVLLLAHRDDLICQAYTTIRWIVPEAEIQIEQADKYARLEQDSLFGKQPRVVIASVPSLCQPRRLKRFDPAKFSLVIVDEAKHAVPKNSTYNTIVDKFLKCPSVFTIGVDATPDRSDGEALEQFFHHVAYQMSLAEAIDEGYLVPIYQIFKPLNGLSFDGVAKGKEDLKAGELSRLLSEEDKINPMCGEVFKVANTGGDMRPTLFFAARVAHAERAAQVFNRLGRKHGWNRPCAAALSGETPLPERRATIAAHKAGEIQFICVCGLFDEGFDAPWIRVVVPRMTLSRSRYEQMIGRGTRPLPGVIDGLATAAERRAAIAKSRKRAVAVLDFHCNSNRHHLISVGDILAGTHSGAAKMAIDKVKNSGGGDMLAEIKAAKRKLAEAEAKRRENIIITGEYGSEVVDPFTIAGISKPKWEPPWFKGKVPTEKMIGYLESQKVATKGMSFFEAKSMIDHLKAREKRGLCSNNQRALLAKHGYDAFDTDRMTFAEAGAAIDAIRANGWKRPPEPEVGSAEYYGM